MPNKFNIGDKVCIRGPWIDGPSKGWAKGLEQYVGTEFTIERINGFDDLYPGPGGWSYCEEWLELVEPVGLKFDTQKAPVGLVFESFPRALTEVAKVAGYGEKKYARGNWLHVENALLRYKDALGRHLLLSYVDDIDEESGHAHLAHALWNLLAVTELFLKERE